MHLCDADPLSKVQALHCHLRSSRGCFTDKGFRFGLVVAHIAHVAVLAWFLNVHLLQSHVLSKGLGGGGGAALGDGGAGFEANAAGLGDPHATQAEEERTFVSVHLSNASVLVAMYQFDVHLNLGVRFQAEFTFCSPKSPFVAPFEWSNPLSVSNERRMLGY